MWYHGHMIDFPIAERMDDSICIIWLERQLHPFGLTCPHCGHSERRLFPRPKPLSSLPLSGLRGLLHAADRDRLREHSTTTGHPGVAPPWGCQGRAYGALGARVGP